MIDENLIAALQALGTPAGARVHTSLLPQLTEYPAVAVTRVTGNDERSLSGELIQSRATFRVDVYGRQYPEMAQTARAIKAFLDGQRRLMGTTQVMWCSADNVADFSDDDGDRKTRHLVLDFSFVYLD